MKTPARPRVYYGWVIVAVAFFMNVASSPTNAVAFSFFVGPMSDDLGWSRGSLALGLTFRLAVAGVSAPFVGVLVDRIGARLLGTAASVVAGLSLLGLALVHDIWFYYLLFAISGLSGFGGPAGQLLTTVPVAKWFQAKRGRAMAIATTGMPLGTAIFIPLLQALIAGYDWRLAWAVSGLLVLVIAVPACAIFMRKDPESQGLATDGGEEEPAHSEKRTAVVEEDWTLSQALRSFSFWRLLAYIALTGLMIQGALVYRTSHWEDIGMSSSQVALGTSVDPLMVVFSGLFFGLMAERVRIRYLGWIGLTGVACSMIPLFLAQNSFLLLLSHYFIWGCFMGGNITANNVIWPDYFGRRHLGTIRGVVFPFAVGTAAVSPPFFALLLNVLEPDKYIWIVAFLGFAAAGLLVLSTRPPRRRAPTLSAPKGSLSSRKRASFRP